MKLFLSFLALFLGNNLFAQQIDSTFHSPVPYKEAKIRDMLFTQDGGILVAGEIDRYEDVLLGGLVKLNADGTRDESFHFEPVDYFTPTYLAALQNGNFVVCNHKSILLISPKGTLLDSIQSLGGIIHAVSVYMETTLLVAGDFDSSRYANVVRLTSDLEISEDFNNSFSVNGPVYDIDGYTNIIYIAGDFSEINGIEQHDIARIRYDGSLNEVFDTGTGTEDIIRSIFVQPQNAMVLVPMGYKRTFNGESALDDVIRLDLDGSRDHRFSFEDEIIGLDKPIFFVEDKFYFLGIIYERGAGVSDIRIGRYMLDGSRDETFVAIPTDVYDNRLIANEDYIYVSGRLPKKSKYELSRYTSQGEFNAEFSPKLLAESFFRQVARNEQGIYVRGEYFQVDDWPSPLLARLREDGTVDKRFLFSPDFKVASDFSLLENGQILVAGSDGNLIKVNEDGSEDFSFQFESPKGNAMPLRLEVKKLGKVVVRYQKEFYQLNTDGSLDETVDLNGFAEDDYVELFGLQSDDKIVCIGSITAYKGANADSLMRISADGTLDGSFQMGSGAGGEEIFDIVNNLLVLPQDNIFLTGDFDSMNGQEAHGLAHLDKDGSFLHAYPMGFNTSSESIAVSDTLIYLYGSYRADSILAFIRVDLEGNLKNDYQLPFYGFGRSMVSEQKEEPSLLFAGQFSEDFFRTEKYIFRIFPERENTNIPKIVGVNRTFQVKPEEQLTIALMDLEVEDRDSQYPEDFTLWIAEGEHYSFEGDQVFPEAGFTGKLGVNLSVFDGFYESESYTVEVEVTENAVTRINEDWINTSVYPNPATSVLTIKSQANEGMHVQGKIFTSQGKLVRSVTLKQQETRVEVHSLPPGLYYIRLRGSKATKAFKFFKI